MKTFPKILLSSLLAIILVIGFTLPANPPNGNWYQQFLPNLTNFQVSDIFFLDSLTGWAVSGNSKPNDTSGYILKTTNGGDNWTLKFTDFRDFSRVIFINANTGFVSGGYATGAKLYKSTDGGNTWNTLFGPSLIYFDDMSVLDENTIWLVDHFNPEGGVFLTTNGGGGWTQQLNLGSLNPEKIYMFNARIGFISKNLGSSGYVRKTTDGGASWSLIVSNDYYQQIYFVDSLTGWKCSVFGMKKTSNGGLNWVTQTLPSGGIIQTNGISSFTNINKDTIWANGGYVLYPNNQTRSILNHTTNGGTNWLFQIPDTSINIDYFFITFTDKLHGWVTDIVPTRGEIHTTNGGDTTFLVGMRQVSSQVPVEYKLFQNYPNPFNPSTVISYQLRVKSYVKMSVYDITGKHITDLVNQKQTAGTYQVDFSGNGYSSGIYFYSLIIGGVLTGVKKMVLIK